MLNKEIWQEGNIKFLAKSNKTSTETFNVLSQKEKTDPTKAL